MVRWNGQYQIAVSKMLNTEQKAEACETVPIAIGTDSPGSVGTAGKYTASCGQKKIIHYFKLVFLPALVLIAVSSPAQRILTLDEAIANALQKNYDIILSRNDSAIAAIDYSYRGA